MVLLFSVYSAIIHSQLPRDRRERGGGRSLPLHHLARQHVQRLGVLEVLNHPGLEDVDLAVGVQRALAYPAADHLANDQRMVADRHLLVERKLDRRLAFGNRRRLQSDSGFGGQARFVFDMPAAA